MQNIEQLFTEYLFFLGKYVLVVIGGVLKE